MLADEDQDEDLPEVASFGVSKCYRRVRYRHKVYRQRKDYAIA
jgi:hypothetical protein